MKNPFLVSTLITLILVGCSGPGPASPTSSVSPTSTPKLVTAIVTIESTRLVVVTATPRPKPTSTPRPTISEMDVVDTQVAIAIGTPIVASNCYDSNSSQLTLNGCSNQRREELVKQMALLVKSVLDIWQERSPEKADRFSSLQEEWENWVKRNCEFSAGLTLIDDGGVLRYEGGSMAVLLFNECLIHQYEPRLRDLQVLLYELGI